MKKAKKTAPSDLQAADNIEDLKEKIRETHDSFRSRMSLPMAGMDQNS
ncbi:hypothetical protein [Dialister invisus]|nr:hypothetical protein [Dialister invisus]